jgi:NTP pyrophosphatase (non-canonical NTP hydrolase)
MGSDAAPPPGLYVKQLMEHASSLRREARAAFDVGDYPRAADLLARAEMLAADVGELVDAIEAQQADDMMRLAAERHAGSTSKRRARRGWLRTTRARIGAVLGASLAIGLALVGW